MQATISLVNHASVKLGFGKEVILTDPWYSGPVFHKGWQLIHPLNESEILNSIQDVNYIYISHEHPDHFYPGFFVNNKIKDVLTKNKVKILFQHTKDKRVLDFLKKKNFEVIEIKENDRYNISPNINIQIIKSGYIDSALIIETPETKIVNLNDCPLNEPEKIKKFKNKHGKFDILLSQFSYAAWKGGKNNSEYRKIAAEEKIKTMMNQYKILECKHVIPFASFVYFSNELNNYMNDCINKPENLIKKLGNEINAIILSPGEKQWLHELRQNQDSITFWKDKYKQIPNLPVDKYSKSITYEELKKDFQAYKNRILKINSKILIYFASKIKSLNYFQPINIFLIDHNKNYEFSLTKDFKINENVEPDIKMHSESLQFIFNNNFGFDTLTVNGCFEASKEGFLKTTKTFAIGTLNSMGLKLNLGLLFNIKLIFFFLNLLKKVVKRL